MTYFAAIALTAVLAGSLGWTWGHATARVRVTFIGWMPDPQPIRDDIHDKFDQIIAGYDDEPEQP